MTLAKRKNPTATPEAVFAPGDEPNPFDWQTQERRKFELVKAFRLRWPPSAKERFDLFDTWHDVAMQIVQRERRTFRMMAVAKKVINWQKGVITCSNADLAARAGFCSEKTISREVGDYVSIGVFIMEMGWRREGTQIVRTRSIFPAIPSSLPDGLRLPDGGVDLDTSGPDGEAVDLDTSGPGDLDTSGPITIETIREGSADAA
ncbi:hypothetical protein QBK99_05355 [Corticibacterium sp. UT-5YL-CI-8]|nr:hypothetical protein [Tianweitania sp. UT-5YL-CI-8]